MTSRNPPSHPTWRLTPTEPDWNMVSAAGCAIWESATENHHQLARNAVRSAISASPSPLDDAELVEGMAFAWAESEGIPWENRSYRQRARLLKGARAVLAYLSGGKEG